MRSKDNVRRGLTACRFEEAACPESLLSDGLIGKNQVTYEDFYKEDQGNNEDHRKKILRFYNH